MELPRLWLWSPHLVKISEIWYKEKVLQHWDAGVLFLTQMQGVATVTRNPYQLRMCNYLSSQQTWSPLCTTYPYACRYAHQYTFTCTYWYAYGYSLGTVDLGTNTNLPEYAAFTETGNLFSKHQISMKVNWRIFHHLCWDKKNPCKILSAISCARVLYRVRNYHASVRNCTHKHALFCVCRCYYAWTVRGPTGVGAFAILHQRKRKRMDRHQHLTCTASSTQSSRLHCHFHRYWITDHHTKLHYKCEACILSHLARVKGYSDYPWLK